MTKIKYPRWATLLIEIYRCNEDKRYCQRLLRRVNMAHSHLKKLITAFQKCRFIKLDRKGKSKKIKFIDITPKGESVAVSILDKKKYCEKDKYGDLIFKNG